VTLTMARGLSAHLERLDDLHVFPAAATKVLEVARQPMSSLADMERAVAMDSVLAGRVLKLANSPMYARQTRVSSVERAIAALGFRGTRDIALALAIGGIGSDRSPWAQRAWVHAMAVGWAAKSLARHIRHVDAESAFVTGLLHDVGLQLMITLHEEETNRMLDARGSLDGTDLEDERRLFGTDHAELGAAALRRWSLPDGVSDAVAAHHLRIGRCGVARPRDVALLHVADALAGAVPLCDTVEEVASMAMQHPSAPVLRAVRGVYVASAELLVNHWDRLADFG